jgi:hypothetical protein
MRRTLWSVLATSLALTAVVHAEPARAPCPRGPVSPPAAIEPLFAELRLDRLERLRAEFSEEKRIALLARPLRRTGTLYFDRSRGIARLTRAPRPERMVLTTSVLRIEKNGAVEEIPIRQSKALRAFAMVFPAILRGERAELETAFAIRVDGSARAEWTLTLTPRDPSLCGLVARVVVAGRGAEVSSLQVVEASGDVTSTRLSGIARNGAVPAAEVAQSFGGR